MRGRFPVTPLGVGALVGMVLTYAVGWWLAWIEYVVVGCGFAVVLLLAVPFVFGRRGLVLSRAVEPIRVSVRDDDDPRPRMREVSSFRESAAAGHLDGEAISHLTITNDGRFPSPGRTVEDRVGGAPFPIQIPALKPGVSHVARWVLPRDRRGVFPIGPALVTLSDPLGLLRRDLGRIETQHLWVHPRIVGLPPLHSGFAKDLEGPTFDTSPAGDVAFHTIRDYAPGDDIRHIHWMSTARTGTLMVRHYVDNRRPYLGVLVDGDPGAYQHDQFERALEAAASHVDSAARDRRPLALWVGSQQVMSRQAPTDRDGALDRLCQSACVSEGLTNLELYQELRQVDQDISALVWITGGRPAEDLLPVTSAAVRHGDVIVVRFVDPGTPPAHLPDARVLDCRDLDDFAAVWSRVVA